MFQFTPHVTSPLCLRYGQPHLYIGLWTSHLKEEVSSSIHKTYVMVVVQTQTEMQKGVWKRKEEATVPFAKAISLFKKSCDAKIVFARIFGDWKTT